MPLQASETTSSEEGDTTSVGASNPGAEQEEPGCDPPLTIHLHNQVQSGRLSGRQDTPVASGGQPCGQNLRHLAVQPELRAPLISGGICGRIHQALAGSPLTSRTNVPASCGRYNRMSQTSGLPQHKCILPQFWSPKSKPLAGLVLSGGFVETRGIAFPVPRDACILGSGPCPHRSDLCSHSDSAHLTPSIGTLVRTVVPPR